MDLFVLCVDAFVFLNYNTWCLDSWARVLIQVPGWLFISDFKFRSVNQHLFILWTNPLLYGTVVSRRSDWFFLGQKFFPIDHKPLYFFCFVLCHIINHLPTKRVWAVLGNIGPGCFCADSAQLVPYHHDMTSSQYSPIQPFCLVSGKLGIISVTCKYSCTWAHPHCHPSLLTRIMVYRV